MEQEEALELITNPEVEEYLDTEIVQGLLEMMCIFPVKLGDYYGPHHWVLQHGQYFINKQRDRQFGPQKLCYYNSQMLMTRNIGSLSYVEGYVLAYHPTSHGWNIDTEGEVIDTTLRLEDKEYFGFVFSDQFVLKNLVEQEATVALIEDWQQDYPLLKKSDDLLLKATKDPWNWLWPVGM